MFSDTGSAGSGLATNMVKQALLQKLALKKQWEGIKVAEPALVEEYDPAAGTVSVTLKNFPNQAPRHGVLVIGMGGPWMHVWPIIPFSHDPANATVGIVLFLTSDTSNSFSDRTIQTPPSRNQHSTIGAVFIPDCALDSDDVPDAVADEDAVVKPTFGSVGWVHRKTKAAFLLQPDGSLEASLTAVRLFRIGKTAGDLKKVARDDDPGDGGLGVGPITGTGFLEVTD